MDINTNPIELMSSSRYRCLCQAGLAGMTNEGIKRVYTPNGWAKVELIDQELETELKEVTRTVMKEFLAQG